MKHFLATAALGALLIGAMPLSSFAETPKDQLIVATTMSNILTLDPAAITGRETVQVLNNVYDTLVVLSLKIAAFGPALPSAGKLPKTANRSVSICAPMQNSPPAMR